MIVTKDLILSITPEGEFLDWLARQDIYGLTRGEFIAALKAADADQLYINYYESNKGLFSPGCIKQHSKTIEHSKWKCWGENLDQNVEYSDLEELKTLLKYERDLRFDKDKDIFHVHAVEIVDEQGARLSTRVTEEDYQHTFAHYYDTFNCYAGNYENFNTFWLAQSRMMEIKHARKKEISSCYHIYQYIQEVDNPEENAAGWLLVETAETID